MEENPDLEFKKRAAKVVERIFKIDEKNNYKSIKFMEAVNLSRIANTADQLLRKVKNTEGTIDFFNLCVIHQNLPDFRPFSKK